MSDKKRVALVTGGMGGLGEAICIKLARLGNNVITTYSPGNAKAPDWLAGMRAQGYDIKAYECDVTSWDSCVACVARITAEVGPVEVLVNNQNEPPSLLRQSSKNQNHWIILKLIGTHSNRSAIGARVSITAGGRKQLDEIRSGGSYLSQNDLRLHFGLGLATRVDELRIDWPGGTKQVEHDLPVNRITVIKETIR